MLLLLSVQFQNVLEVRASARRAAQERKFRKHEDEFASLRSQEQMVEWLRQTLAGKGISEARLMYAVDLDGSGKVLTIAFVYLHTEGAILFLCGFHLFVCLLLSPNRFPSLSGRQGCSL